MASKNPRFQQMDREDLSHCADSHFLSPDKVQFKQNKILICFFFLHEYICCGYSLEVPR